MRSFGALFVGGVTGILILKVLGALLFPFLGLMGLVLKITLFGVVAYLVYTLLRGRRKKAEEV